MEGNSKAGRKKTVQKEVFHFRVVSPDLGAHKILQT